MDLIDVDSATPQELARYTLIILPGALALAPATQQQPMFNALTVPVFWGNVVGGVHTPTPPGFRGGHAGQRVAECRRVDPGQLTVQRGKEHELRHALRVGLVADLGQRRDEDHRDVGARRVCLQALAYFIAVDVRHHYVQQDQGGPHGLEQGQRFLRFLHGPEEVRFLLDLLAPHGGVPPESLAHDLGGTSDGSRM